MTLDSLGAVDIDGLNAKQLAKFSEAIGMMANRLLEADHVTRAEYYQVIRKLSDEYLMDQSEVAFGLTFAASLGFLTVTTEDDLTKYVNVESPAA